MAEFLQELDGLRRHAGIRQKSHCSRPQVVKFVLRESGRVSECLANVFLFEVGQLVHHLCRRHPTGNPQPARLQATVRRKTTPGLRRKTTPGLRQSAAGGHNRDSAEAGPQMVSAVT